MESKANYALVGMFSTLAVAALLGFIYWFSSADSGVQRTPYDVVFTGAVTGLSTGTDVLFNGIRVGQVDAVSIDPTDPSRVIARVSVDSTAPVMNDTRAVLEVQGLTGIGYVQLLGGTATAGRLEPMEGAQVAALAGEQSGFQAILDGARDTIDSASSAFARIDTFLAANEDRVTTTLANIEDLSNALSQLASTAGGDEDFAAMIQGVRETITSAGTAFSRLDGMIATNEERFTATLTNIETFSGALAANSDGFETLLENLTQASTEIGPLATELRGLSTDVRGIVDAIPPEDISRAFTNIASFSDTLADNQQAFATTLANIETFSSALAENSEGIETMVANLSQASTEIGPLATELRGLSTDVRGIVDAIPPEDISRAFTNIASFSDTLADNQQAFVTTLANIETFSSALAENSEGFETMVANLSQASTEIGPLATELRGLSTDVRGIVDAIPPEDISRAFTNIASFSDTLADNQQAFATTLSNIETFSSALAENSEGIEAMVANLSQASTEIGPLATELRGLSTDVRGLVDSVPPEDVRRAFANIASFSDTLAANQDRFSSTLANVDAFSGALAANSDGLETFLSSLTEAGNEIGPLAVELSNLSRDVRALVDAIPPDQVTRAVTNIASFADTLSRNTDGIDAFFADTGQLASNLTGISEGLQSTLQVIDQASTAIDPAVIDRAMRNIDRFSEAIGTNADNVDEIVSNATELSRTLNATATQIESIVNRVDTMVAAEDGDSMFAEFTNAAQALRDLAVNLDQRTEGTDAVLVELADAARSVRTLAESLDRSTAEIASGLTTFTGRGLSEYVTLATEGRATLRRLDRVIGNIERNPQSVIFGGDTVREYTKR